MKSPDEPWPPYCCVILVDEAGRFVMEQRPPDEAARTGGLTCLGGGREPEEHPDLCIVRELQEEIGWTPPEIQRIATFSVGERLIAWFYTARYSGDPPIHREAGYSIELISASEVTGPRVSRWHRAVFDGWLRGETQIRIAP